MCSPPSGELPEAFFYLLACFLLLRLCVRKMGRNRQSPLCFARGCCCGCFRDFGCVVLSSAEQEDLES